MRERLPLRELSRLLRGLLRSAVLRLLVLRALLSTRPVLGELARLLVRRLRLTVLRLPVLGLTLLRLTMGLAVLRLTGRRRVTATRLEWRLLGRSGHE